VSHLEEKTLISPNLTINAVFYSQWVLFFHSDLKKILPNDSDYCPPPLMLSPNEDEMRMRPT
jgi:hypothetical protein